MKHQIPKGLFDIQPSTQAPKDQWRSAELWSSLEQTLRRLAKSFNYSEIRTPIFEKTELFTRSAGDTSDIVFKEMYTFEDKGKRSMTLRPEGTAPVIRSLIESATLHENPIQRLFYMGPYFRYDRPQAGRYRQFHQFGVEAIGIADPEQDAEVIELLHRCLSALNIDNIQLHINSIGSPQVRCNYCQALANYLAPLKGDLSADSQARLEANPLRILDSKAPQDQQLLKGAPTINEFLDADSDRHFKRVLHLLEALDIPYHLEPKLVRGLDYYNHTVFEFTAGELGAQNTIGAGGRYDGLIGKLGGQDLPSIGFAVGIERLLQTMLSQGATEPAIDGPKLLIVPMGEEAKCPALKLASQMRQEGHSCTLYLKGKKIQKALQYADKIGAKHLLIMGEEELKSQVVKVREMSTRQEESFDLEQLSSWLSEKL